jgi:nuclear pore complex protein Nup188
VSLVSLLILKLPLVLDHLLGEAEQLALVSDGSPEAAPYFINPSAISEIQAILTEAAGSCLITASPAVFAWSIILQTMREVVRTRKEARELRQSQRAAYSFSEVESTETEAGESSTTEPGSGAASPRPQSIGSDISSEPSMYDEVLDDLMKSAIEEDPISYLAKSAVNGSRVFEVIQGLAAEFCTPLSADIDGQDGLRMRVTLLHLVRASLEWVEYQPEVVLAALAVLQGGEGYWEFVDAPAIPAALNPSHLFLSDQLLCEKLLDAAVCRFPYEPIPFLRLFKALDSSWSSGPVDDEGTLHVVSRLECVPSFTQTLPPNFTSYELAHEEDGRNMVQLTRSLRLFGWRDRHRALLTQATRNQEVSTETNGYDGSEVPAGTLGVILFESRPMVAIWYHKYSALKYIGRALESALMDSGVVECATGAGVTKDAIVEMVGLITMLLTSSTKAARFRDDVVSAAEAAQRILEDASDGVGRNRDVIAIIFDLFEEELQEQQLHPGTDRSMDLLVNCMHFIYALIPVLPGRVWAFLARSGLLEIEGRGGKLAAIIAGTEMMSGRYEVLTSCIRIFDALVEDAVTCTIARKGSNTRVVARFNSPTAMATGVSEKVMKDILQAFARTIVDVFESSPGWKFAVLGEKLEIGTKTISVMDKIMCYSYSVDDSPDLSSKVTGVLAPTARFLSDVFLSASTSDTAVRPMLQIFCEGIGTPNSTLFLHTLHSWTAQVQAMLKFSTTLIRVGRLIRLPTSYLEKQLFKASPLLARLYAAHETYRLPVVALFESLVASAAASEQEPPSLLGHLGPETAKNFLSVLSNLDKPIDDDELDIQIWNLLSAVVSNRQQWLAIYLLTGNTPRGSLAKGENNSTSGAPRGEPLLAVALNSLADIQSLPPRRALAMLEFVALAEDYWPWAMADMHKHPQFVNAISDFVGKLDAQAPTVESANKIRMASLIAEILAMYLHHLRQLGDNSFAKKLVPNLGYYMNNAVSAPSYNLSLHSNLRKNFEMKFPNTTLLNFKRTQLQRRYFGPEYFYDIDLATKLLRFEPSWSGIRGGGFSYDVAQANINLSVVEAQVVSSLIYLSFISLVNLCPSSSSTAGNSSQSNLVSSLQMTRSCRRH